MHEDILDDTQFNSKAPKFKSWFLLLVLHFVLFGAGLFYADNSRKRYWIYILCAVYAWAAFANVFIKLIPDFEPSIYDLWVHGSPNLCTCQH